MLSDKVPTHIPRRTKAKKTGWYTDSQKLEAVKMWLMCGNLNTTAMALNIPLVTIKSWRYSKWWDEVCNELRTEGTIQLSQGLKKVAEKALEVTLDRLENGDWQYDPKSGKMVRKPVLMRDANRVANDMLDKHMELEKKPVQEEAIKATQDRLEQLASTFASFAKKVRRIDVEDIGETHTAVAWKGSEKTQGNGLQVIEQDGPYEGERTDSEGPGEELHDSGGESERQAS